MLEQVYKSYRNKADEINWKDRDCNDLFFEYINHENDNLKDTYLSAIICRYWGYAGRVYLQCNKHVPFEDCYDCVIDTIRYVLKKRVWENENSSLYQDHAAPDKAFHIALKRQRGIMLSKLNTNKRKSNFNMLSLDEFHEEYADSADGLLFEYDSSEETMKHLISNYFNSNDYINALFLDLICFSNYEKFSLQKVVRDLKLLNIDNLKYYKSEYIIDENIFKETLREIKKYSNRLLIIKLKVLLNNIKRDR